MGRTLRKKLKRDLAAPFLVYLIRKWRFNTRKETQNKNESSWWDDLEDERLPKLPESWREQGLLTPEYDKWLRETYPPNDTYIRVTKEYTYRNS